MISNYVLRTEIDSLKKRKRELGIKKKELEAAFQDCGVSRNQAYKINSTGKSSHSESTIKTRAKLGKEMKKLEEEFADINNRLRQCFSEEEAVKNMKLMEVFKDIFTQDQILEIKKEAQRRMAGEPAFKMSFSVKDAEQSTLDARKYKQLAREQLEKMIEFRVLLTGLIEEGCAKFGNAEFLKFISPLNRLIIPLSELEKIKRKENL